MVAIDQDAHLEFTHVWGFGGVSNVNTPPHKTVPLANEGWNTVDAVTSANRRFREISNRLAGEYSFLPTASESYWLHLARPLPKSPHQKQNKSFEEAAKAAIEKLSSPHTPNYAVCHLATMYEGHAIAFSFVKTGDDITAIYINRLIPTRTQIKGCVQVYKLNIKQVLDLIDTIVTAQIVSTEYKVRAAFINVIDAWSNYYDPATSRRLDKDPQDVVNCTVANRNITFHIHLAAYAMQHLGFTNLADAYDATRAMYKKVRLNDKAQCLIELLRRKAQYPSQSFHELLLTALTKAYVKSLSKQKKERPGYSDALLHELLRNNQNIRRVLLDELANIPSWLEYLQQSSVLTKSISWHGKPLKWERSLDDVMGLDLKLTIRQSLIYWRKILNSSLLASVPTATQLASVEEPSSVLDDFVAGVKSIGSRIKGFFSPIPKVHPAPLPQQAPPAPLAVPHTAILPTATSS